MACVITRVSKHYGMETELKFDWSILLFYKTSLLLDIFYLVYYKYCLSFLFCKPTPPPFPLQNDWAEPQPTYNWVEMSWAQYLNRLELVRCQFTSNFVGLLTRTGCSKLILVWAELVARSVKRCVGNVAKGIFFHQFIFIFDIK